MATQFGRWALYVVMGFFGALHATNDAIGQLRYIFPNVSIDSLDTFNLSLALFFGFFASLFAFILAFGPMRRWGRYRWLIVLLACTVSFASGHIMSGAFWVAYISV